MDGPGSHDGWSGRGCHLSWEVSEFRSGRREGMDSLEGGGGGRRRRGRRGSSRAQQGWGGEGESASAGEGQEDIFLIELELPVLDQSWNVSQRGPEEIKPRSYPAAALIQGGVKSWRGVPKSLFRQPHLLLGISDLTAPCRTAAPAWWPIVPPALKTFAAVGRSTGSARSSTPACSPGSHVYLFCFVTVSFSVSSPGFSLLGCEAASLGVICVMARHNCMK